jgi:putative nucleotidyltransferase with HDIG domain
MSSALRERWWPRSRLALATLALVAVSTFLLSFPLFPSGRLVLDEGDVAPRDIRAPRPLNYESAIRTTEQQRLAEAAVEPVYTFPDADRARQRLERTQQVIDYLSSVRADSFASPSQRRAWILAVGELADMPMAAADGLLALPDESWNRVQLETHRVVGAAMRQGVREGFVEEARALVPSLVGLDLSAEEEAATVALARRLLVANSFYDDEATQSARAQARENVSPVLRTYGASEIIVREGQRIGALELEALQELGLQQPRTRWIDVAGNAALAAAGFALLGLFLARFQADVLWEGRKLLLVTLLLAFFLFLARLMVPDRAVLRYLFPGPALAMLATAALGPYVGIASSVLMGSAVGLIADGSLHLAAYVIAGGVVATLGLRRADRLAAIFRVSLFVALTHVVVLAGFSLPQARPDFVELLLQLMVSAINPVVSASLALGGLFLIGPLFDVITTFRLIELSRPDHPLLQRLLREAPGTYHHSLMVASLAEQAAERIGADALLTRVGAYYHDVGKIARPYFFIENQIEGVNPHERLDPYTSTEIIVGHVRDGIELARRFRLPARVRAFIPEHHGTKRASFQYERALELAGDAQLVNEADFHHQGPRPQTRETALVMLADGCEAVVRARRPATPEDLAEALEEVFDRALRSGQLDECPMTLRELRAVRDSFISTLKGVFHPRIRYPERVEPVDRGEKWQRKALGPVQPGRGENTGSEG